MRFSLWHPRPIKPTTVERDGQTVASIATWGSDSFEDSHRYTAVVWYDNEPTEEIDIDAIGVSEARECALLELERRYVSGWGKVEMVDRHGLYL